MGADERVQGAGVFVWERGSERVETGNRIKAEIGDDAVSCEIGGASGKTETIEVTSKEGIRALRKLAYAMQQTGRKPRPFAGSFWKPTTKRKSTRIQTSVECPACRGIGELGCDLCRGEGWVSVDQIEERKRQ